MTKKRLNNKLIKKDRFLFRIKLVLYIGLIVSLFSIYCNRHTDSIVNRVGIFPAFQNNLAENLVLTEILCDHFPPLLDKNTYLASPEWISSSLEWDSLSSPKYFNKHCQRIGIEEYYLIDWLPGNPTRVRIERFSSSQLDSSLTIQDLEAEDLSILTGKAVQTILSTDTLPDVQLFPMSLLSKVSEARMAYYKKDFNLAVSLWRELLESEVRSSYIHKSAVKSLLQLALINKKQGEYAEHLYLEIEFLLNQLLDISPPDTETDYLFGKMYVRKERWNKAQSSLLEAYETMQDHPFLLLELAHMHATRYHETGYRNKVQLLSKACIIHPGFDEAWLMLGNHYFATGKKRKTETTFQQMLKYHPGSMDALLSLGKLYMLENRFVQIVEIYEEILAKDPQFSDAYYNLGIAYLRDDKVKIAKALFKRAIEIDNHRDSHYYLGMLFFQESIADSARIYFQERLSLRQSQDDEFADEALRMLRKIDSSQSNQ